MEHYTGQGRTQDHKPNFLFSLHLKLEGEGRKGADGGEKGERWMVWLAVRDERVRTSYSTIQQLSRYKINLTD